MISLLVLLVIIPSIFYALFRVHTSDPKAVGSKVGHALPLQSKVPPLSPVAKVVLKEYNSLPIESRPFDNIEDILVSLDATTAHLKRNDHFDENYQNRFHGGYSTGAYTNFKFSWTAASIPRPDSYLYLSTCKHTNCDFSTYYDLHLEIQRVKEALDKKRLALVRSDNAHNVALAAELVKALCEEAGIQDKTTARLKEIG